MNRKIAIIGAGSAVFSLNMIRDIEIPGVNHFVWLWGWWYHRDDLTEARWKESPGRFWQRFFAGGVEEVAEIRRIGFDPSVRVTDHFRPEHSHEVIVPVIESLLCDVPRVLIGNVANAGDYVPGVPRDFAVEVPVSVDGGGLRPVPTAGLPPAPLAHLLRDCVAQVNLELEAQ